MNNKYDIVVIGSGVGGLVSAALLSELDEKILIIEKGPGPGGYLTEFRSGDFIFDVSLHLLNGCGLGQYSHELFRRCGIIDEIKFLRPKYLYRSIFPDYDIKVPQADVEAYKDMLIKLFPNSRKGIEGLFVEMRDVFDAASNLRASGRISSVLIRHVAGTFASVIDRYIDDHKLKALICQFWIYFGLPPSMLRAIDFSYPCFDYLNNGGYYLEKGSYEIVRALVRRIEASGGKFLFSKAVEKISIKDSGCHKVSFGRDEVLCDTIISNMDIEKTVHELMGPGGLGSDAIKKLGNISPSISAFELFLGLDVDLNEKYPDDYEIFVNSGYDIEEQYKDCVQNNAHKAPFVITINSNVNRFSAPKGKSVVTIIMLSGYSFWRSKSREEYLDDKDRLADILIGRASRIIPEIKSRLTKKIVSTPVTFERYTNNREGAIYGYSRTLGQKAEVKPNDMKEMRNLYFASGWAKQGSGVAKVLNAADDVYKKILERSLEKIIV
jgi:prolycopene isomerase